MFDLEVVLVTTRVRVVRIKTLNSCLVSFTMIYVLIDGHEVKDHCITYMVPMSMLVTSSYRKCTTVLKRCRASREYLPHLSYPSEKLIL